MQVLGFLWDNEKAKKWLMDHRKGIEPWLALFMVILLIFLLISDRDFSFLLTCGSIIALFSFLMVAAKIETNGSCAGVSIRMMECYLILLLARLFSIIPFEGYLPYDRSGDWLYQSVEALNLVIVASIVYMGRVRYKDSYNKEADKLNPVFLVIPAALLSFLFHPNLNAFMPADAAWSFALYLEAVSCLPQLLMFQKEGKVQDFTTHFLAGQALSKICSFIFWIHSFGELNDPTRPLKSYAGTWVVVMQAVQLLVMADFLYHYVRCVTRGVSVQYILTEDV